MEQLTVGSLMHAEILWEAAVDVANSGDLVSLLEHRIVALYMEKLLNRERYLGALTEHLSACGTLLKASNLSETIVATALEESLSRAEKIVNRREEPSSSPSDNMPLGEQELSEKRVEDLVTVRTIREGLTPPPPFLQGGWSVMIMMTMMMTMRYKEDSHLLPCYCIRHCKTS